MLTVLLHALFYQIALARSQWGKPSHEVDSKTRRRAKRREADFTPMEVMPQNLSPEEEETVEKLSKVVQKLHNWPTALPKLLFPFLAKSFKKSIHIF